jgi:hypothetical protein
MIRWLEEAPPTQRLALEQSSQTRQQWRSKRVVGKVSAHHPFSEIPSKVDSIARHMIMSEGDITSTRAITCNGFLLYP